MNREEIIRMAREAGVRAAKLLHEFGTEGALCDSEIQDLRAAERLAKAAYAAGAAAERNILAAWMIQFGFATGHGDTTEALLQELDWQIAERIAAIRARSNT